MISTATPVALPRSQVTRIWGNILRRDPKPRFSKERLADWLLEQSIQRKGFGWRCAYSGELLAIDAISIDHRLPLAAGGLTELPNLAICSQRWNRIKGQLSEERFRALLALMELWPDKERSDVLKRLGQAPSFRQWQKKPKAKKVDEDW